MPQKNTKNEKKWSTRFRGRLDEKMQAFQSSLPFDGRLYHQDICGSIAHLNTLCAAKVITEKEKVKLQKGLRLIEKELDDALYGGKSGENSEKNAKKLGKNGKNSGQSGKSGGKDGKMGENSTVIQKSGAQFVFGNDEDDIHMWIEKRLGEVVGPLAAKLHTARSRNDQVSTDLRLYTRATIDQHLTHLCDLLSTLYHRATQHLDDLMPGHTHLQAAQPMTFSFYLLAYFFMLQRDVERLRDCRKRMNFSPLGSGAFCGVNYPIDRKIAAKELHFDGVLENAMDGVADRDYLLEYHHCASTTMVHLSRMAEDFIIFSSAGFDFLEIDDGYTTGSSIMPNKKNPDACELIRGKVGRTFGNMHALYTTIKAQPLAYNRDLQEDKEGLWDTEKTLNDCLILTEKMINTLRIKKENMLEALEKGHILATEVADFLVGKGMAFRQAHHITGAIVAELVEKKKTLPQMTLADFRRHHASFDPSILTFLNPQNAINRKQSSGSTSIKSVKKQLITAKKVLEKNKKMLDGLTKT